MGRIEEGFNVGPAGGVIDRSNTAFDDLPPNIDYPATGARFRSTPTRTGFAAGADGAGTFVWSAEAGYAAETWAYLASSGALPSVPPGTVDTYVPASTAIVGWAAGPLTLGGFTWVGNDEPQLPAVFTDGPGLYVGGAFGYTRAVDRMAVAGRWLEFVLDEYVVEGGSMLTGRVRDGAGSVVWDGAVGMWFSPEDLAASGLTLSVMLQSSEWGAHPNEAGSYMVVPNTCYLDDAVLITPGGPEPEIFGAPKSVRRRFT